MSTMLTDAQSPYAVNSIPAQIYTLSRGGPFGHWSSEILSMPFETNQKTMIIIQECKEGVTFRFRVACVSMNEDGTLHVRDLPTSLAEEGAHGASHIWADTTGALEGVEISACDEATIQNLVQNLKEAQVKRANRG